MGLISVNSSFFISIMGRRTLYILGLSIPDFLLLFIGIWALLGDGGKELPWAKWAQAVTQMIFYGCYTAFIGKPLSQPHERAQRSRCYAKKRTLTLMRMLTLNTGPVCYSIVGEASSTRLRNKSIALGRITYAIFTLVMNILNTYMINASAWNWRGKTAFFCELSLAQVSSLCLSPFTAPHPLFLHFSSLLH